MKEAVSMWSGGDFSRTNIQRAAVAVAGVQLTSVQIEALFYLFDQEGDNKLGGTFVDVMRARQPKRQMVRGLDLAAAASCVTACATSWWDGTR